MLHEFDPVFGVLGKLKRKLMAVVDVGKGEYERIGGGESDVVVLWVLFMGGLLAENWVERDWFAERIARVVRRLGLRSWEEVEECLMKALWIRRMGNKACESLWMVVTEQLEMLDHDKFLILDV